jgi:hypothetical protein
VDSVKYNLLDTAGHAAAFESIAGENARRAEKY